MSSNPGEKKQPRRLAAAFGQWSIAGRLAVWYALASSVVLATALGVLYFQLTGSLDAEDRRFLAEKIRIFREGIEIAVSEGKDRVDIIGGPGMRDYERILEGSGKIVAEAPGMDVLVPAHVFPDVDDERVAPERGLRWRSPEGVPYLLMVTRFPVKDWWDDTRVIQGALDVSGTEALIASYRQRLLVVLVIGLLISAATGWLVARHGMRPLRQITRTIKHISAFQQKERIVPGNWPKELKALAHAFDDMLDRLDDAYTRLSQFSADLAHELRTPINNLMGEAEVALSKSRTAEDYQHTIESSMEELNQVARMIDNLLFLARADNPQAGIEATTFDARDAVEQVIEFYEPLSAEKNLAMECEGCGMVFADKLLFRRALSNLLSNAIEHTPESGRVMVSIAGRNGDGCEIKVVDNGVGIAGEHLPRLFDRFYRVDKSRPRHPHGTGLGLALVKSIMTLHKGGVCIGSKPGGGTTVTLDFPAASER